MNYPSLSVCSAQKWRPIIARRICLAIWTQWGQHTVEMPDKWHTSQTIKANLRSTPPLPLTPLPPRSTNLLNVHIYSQAVAVFASSWQEEAGRVFPDEVRLGSAGCQIYLGLRSGHYGTKHPCRWHTALWGEFYTIQIGESRLSRAAWLSLGFIGKFLTWLT